MTSSFDNRLANLLAVNFNVVQGCTMHFAVEGNAAASPRRIPATLTAAGEPSGDRGGIRRAGDMEIVAINRSRHELFHYKAACSGSNSRSRRRCFVRLAARLPVRAHRTGCRRQTQRRPRLTTIASQRFRWNPAENPRYRSSQHRFLERLEHYSRHSLPVPRTRGSADKSNLPGRSICRCWKLSLQRSWCQRDHASLI